MAHQQQQQQQPSEGPVFDYRLPSYDPSFIFAQRTLRKLQCMLKEGLIDSGGRVTTQHDGSVYRHHSGTHQRRHQPRDILHFPLTLDAQVVPNKRQQPSFAPNPYSQPVPGSVRINRFLQKMEKELRKEMDNTYTYAQRRRSPPATHRKRNGCTLVTDTHTSPFTTTDPSVAPCDHTGIGSTFLTQMMGAHYDSCPNTPYRGHQRRAPRGHSQATRPRSACNRPPYTRADSVPPSRARRTANRRSKSVENTPLALGDDPHASFFRSLRGARSPDGSVRMDFSMLRIRKTPNPNPILTCVSEWLRDTGRRRVFVIERANGALYRPTAADESDSGERLLRPNGVEEAVRSTLLSMHWLEAPPSQYQSPFFDLKWSIRDDQSEYNRLIDGQCFNHFRGNRELTTKGGLTRTLLRYSSEALVNTDTFFPTSYDLGNAIDRQDFLHCFRVSAAYGVLKRHLSIRALLIRTCGSVEDTYAHYARLDRPKTHTNGSSGQQHQQEWPCVYYCNRRLLQLAYKIVEQFAAEVDPNELRESADVFLTDTEWMALLHYAQCLQDDLYREESPYAQPPFVRYIRERGVPDADWGPPTHAFDVSVERLMDDLAERWPQMGLHGSMCTIWILKPSSCSKASGVQCLSDHAEICKAGSQLSNRIIQKYIERPLLVASGRKFDVRQWVLVSSISPLTIYMHTQPYLRLCNLPFDLGDLKNRQKHISNWEVNRGGSYVCEGAVKPLSALIDELPKGAWEGRLLPQIRYIILHTILAATHSLTGREKSFELYGFDILIDEDLHPWLLEVNLSPACSPRTAWLKEMCTHMARGMIDIALHGRCEGGSPWQLILDEDPTDEWEQPKMCVPGSDETYTHKIDKETSSADDKSTCTSPPMSIVPYADEPLKVTGRRIDIEVERRFDTRVTRHTAAIVIQRHVIPYLQRIRIDHFIKMPAIVRIQKAIRRYIARRRMACLRLNSLLSMLQPLGRQYILRKRFQRQQQQQPPSVPVPPPPPPPSPLVVMNRAAIRIQSHYRGHLTRRRSKQTREAIARRRETPDPPVAPSLSLSPPTSPRPHTHHAHARPSPAVSPRVRTAYSYKRVPRPSRYRVPMSIALESDHSSVSPERSPERKRRPSRVRMCLESDSSRDVSRQPSPLLLRQSNAYPVSICNSPVALSPVRNSPKSVRRRSIVGWPYLEGLEEKDWKPIVLRAHQGRVYVSPRK
ncbi:unnamed protein product [Vitrella brassicaformis CCMP3155]|uniref:Tubulin--tyrosine ligase-like protein 9 n=3 Tax=Vitrella brassicaformis TaxID=1169539 RepID=A0A0G4GFL0_VITBC|nr:unnamed protein product [Vitrella brassicaformis CCMP3155]|eukprot:CEM28295.1 unnamed protein product [Vitrella brassicaformis CCMP3155]